MDLRETEAEKVILLLVNYLNYYQFGFYGHSNFTHIDGCLPNTQLTMVAYTFLTSESFASWRFSHIAL